MVGEATDTTAATVQTPAGAVVIRGGIYAKWRALKAETTPDGDDVQAHLEFPLGDQTPVSERHGGGSMQLFRRGMIVERADGRAFVVYGVIYDYYLKMGGPGSYLGQPTSDEEAAPFNGRVSRFQNGDIYWRLDVGVREVTRRSRDRQGVGWDPFARSWSAEALVLFRRVRRFVARRRFKRA
jgi:uncharacterized protein with LGFP repeats